MSRGPGRIERTIAEALEAEPHNAFTTDDLCDRVYPGITTVEKKHRAAVVRAAASLAKRRPSPCHLRSSMRGGTLVFFTGDDVMSYGMARLKADWFIRYRNRRRWPVDSMEQDLVARLAQGGERRHLVEPGGAWWRHTEIWKAERDGNAELVEKLEAEGERQFASTMTASRSRLDPGGRK